MNYIEQILDDGEAIEHSAGVHWVVYLPGLLLMVVATAIALAVATDESRGAATMATMVGTSPFTAVMLITALIRRRTTEIAVTEKRVIVKTGLIRRKTAEINRSKIEGVAVDQSVLGRMLGYGTIAVNGTGGGLAPVKGIDDPIDFRRAVGS